MPAAPRKVCVLGSGGVGKSLLAGRIAQGPDDCGGSARIGTRVLSGLLGEAGSTVALRLWDGPGVVTLDSLGQSLLARSSAWLLVADGSAIETVAALSPLYASASQLVGARPALVLLNKSDLAERWNPGALQPLQRMGPVLAVSARTGAGVEAARDALARLLH